MKKVKKTRIIVLIVILLLLIGGSVLLIMNKNTKKGSLDENKINEVLQIGNEKLDEYLKDINSEGTNEITGKLGSFIKYDDTLKTNTNLFDDEQVKGIIASIIGNLKIDKNSSDDGTIYTVNKDEFTKVYKETWNEEIGSDFQIKDDKVVISGLSGMGIINVKLKAKEIVYENEEFIIKTKVGIIDYENEDYDISYNYDNNYEGQIKFKIIDGKYQIISYVITEI